MLLFFLKKRHFSAISACAKKCIYTVRITLNVTCDSSASNILLSGKGSDLHNYWRLKNTVKVL